MLGYYLEVGIHGLRRNLILTALTVAAIAIGIGTSMTVYTVLHTLSADPIPAKSSRLFTPFIDNWGPDSPIDDTSRTKLTYRDAMAMMRARQGQRQTAMYAVKFVVTPEGAQSRPFEATGRAVYRDFFPMFDVPFEAGGPWTAADDEDKANVAVIGANLAARLFPRSNAVGKTVTLGQHDFRVVGVLGPWNPQPRFYDVAGRDTEDVFLPLSTALDQQIERAGSIECKKMPAEPGWLSYLNSECIGWSFPAQRRRAPTVHSSIATQRSSNASAAFSGRRASARMTCGSG
jgi:putative ABC transport system permease protein